MTARYGILPRACIPGALALALALLLATPARAGVLDSWEGGRENANLIAKLLRERIVEPGLDILRRSTDEDGDALLREADNFFATAKRKTQETAARVIGNHVKAAADRMGLGNAAALGSSIKEKVVGKAVEKVAGFVSGKMWSTAEAAADKLASRQRREEAAGAGEVGTGHGGRPDAAGGPAETVDPLIALDIDEEEREWYRKETDVLDDKPLPEVDAPAAAAPAGHAGGYRSGAAGAPQRQAKQACDDVWSGCPGEEYWNRELQEKAARLDPWADYREAEERAAGGEEDRTEAADRRERGGARACEDDWAGCPGTTGFAGADEGRGGTVESYRPEAPRYPDASAGGGYAAALAGLANESGASSGYGSATSAGGYRAALDRMEKEEADRQRREREAELRREREAAERKEAERARRRAAASSGSGTESSGHTALSSNCEADKPPVCEQALGTAQMQQVHQEAAAQGASISRKKAILAQMALNGINAARTCYSAETRPHCKDMYQRAIRELERTLASTR